MDRVSISSYISCNSFLIDIIGDMNKPIYRYLAERKWRSYKRLLTMQRISQFNIVPDILPSLEPTAAVGIGFGRKKEALGEIVPSKISKSPGKLFIQVYNKGDRLVTLALIDPDVPNFDTDGFEYRCHFLATNVPVSPNVKTISLNKLSEDSQLIFPWLPPYAHKGSPYHRLAFFVLEQEEAKTIDIVTARKNYQRENFKLRRFIDMYPSMPVGVDIFRTKWDIDTDEIMMNLGIEDVGLELRKKHYAPLPYKRKSGDRFR